MRTVFIAGAHTDIGKTHVACALIRAARARGLAVDALKPLVSGFDPGDWAASDPGRLLAALGRAPTEDALAELSPWRFRAPLAPPMAARLEGRAVEFEAVVDACRRTIAAAGSDLLLIEGVGGVMSPISERATCLDLIAALKIPAILVGGAYLGAISHTLTAADCLRGRGVELGAAVVSQDARPDAPDFAETVATTSRFAGLPAIAASRQDTAWAETLLDAIL